MATQKIKKCPHCGFTYYMGSANYIREYGSPLKKCGRCGQYFWDSDIKEPALYGYKNFYETRKKANLIITYLVVTPLALVMIGGGGFYLWHTIKEETTWMNILISLGLLLFGISIAYTIISSLAKKFRDLKNKEAILEEQRKEYDKSMERLNDMKYLEALAEQDSQAEKLLEAKKSGAPPHYAARP